MNMDYTKKDALMTKGLAIILMLLLHLFCRQGNDVFGTPLLWIDKDTPVIYYIVFFPEICVYLYSICAGFGQQCLLEKEKVRLEERWKRIINLLLNYWIVLVLFALISLMVCNSSETLSNPIIFIKNFLLLETYNGAWWYLHSYVVILVIPTTILLWIPNHVKFKTGIGICFACNIIMYMADRLSLLPEGINSLFIRYCYTELVRVVGILPAIWIGALFCRYKIVSRVRLKFLGKFTHSVLRKYILAISFFVLFMGVSVIHKVVFFLPVTIIVFLLFNLWEKNSKTEKLFLFLGKHSTNIWLVHMFFYAYVFEGLVMAVKYPICMLVFMLILCCLTSGIINVILQEIKKLISETKII